LMNLIWRLFVKASTAFVIWITIGLSMPNRTKTHLLLFVRYPVAGGAKTRLIPALGAEGAAALHKRMAEVSADLVRSVSSAGVQGTIWTTGAPELDFQNWLGEDLLYQLQPQGDLGDRLQFAFDYAFEQGGEAALAIGCDAPSLSDSIVIEACDALENYDVVLGPAVDGGYYLIGMKCVHSELFRDITWGTGNVYAQTVAAVAAAGLSCWTLSALSDIDRPEDLASLESDPRFHALLA